ncbi:glycosyltransferase family protein [Pontibacter silvestris]|uniref:glycosyltransferase n=1 Tax=Pontibacter silvestris TaxID=2305183 RepID=UPI001E4E7998|nr:glycosyltransferase [Pontibacter silvestris]
MVNFFEANDIAHRSQIIKYNTDVLYPRNFKLLEDTAINIRFNDSNRSFLHFLSLYSVQKLAEKIKVDLTRCNLFNQQLKTVYVPQKLLENKALFFSHGFFPAGIRRRGIPVLTNTGFMTNEYEGIYNDDERWHEVNQICKMSSQSTFITFSSNNAIERFCSFAPYMKYKVKLAPFLIPKIGKLTEDEMYNKHFGKVLKICFVGIDGKRKGLSNVLAAIRNIYQRDNNLFTNCEFSFVTRDPVVLPQSINYKHYKYLANASVLKLLRESAIFYMPTLKDAYGLVYLEAMGNGCAVLCDNEMPRMEIFDQSLAHFTDPNSLSQIELGLMRLISDKVYRFEMATKSYMRFSKHYSFETVSSYYKDLFQETVDAEHFFVNTKHRLIA